MIYLTTLDGVRHTQDVLKQVAMFLDKISWVSQRLRNSTQVSGKDVSEVSWPPKQATMKPAASRP